MQINSVWHITSAGRSIRIDSFSDKVTSKDVVVFTKQINSDHFIKEKTRIMPEKIATLMNLRKYLLLTENTSVVAGPFEIRLESSSTDNERHNISINNKLFFLSFIPDSIFFPPEGITILLPADSKYFDIDDVHKAIKLLSSVKPDLLVISGDLCDKWEPALSKKFNLIVINEIIQHDIFK